MTRHAAFCLSLTLSACCLALLCAGAAVECSAAPAPLPAREKADQRPAYLCGTWLMGWQFHARGPAPADEPGYEIELGTDGNYLCRHYSGEGARPREFGWVGRWRYERGAVTVWERGIGAEDLPERHRRFLLLIDGTVFTEPPGAPDSDHRLRTWIVRPKPTD